MTGFEPTDRRKKIGILPIITCLLSHVSLAQSGTRLFFFLSILLVRMVFFPTCMLHSFDLSHVYESMVKNTVPILTIQHPFIDCELINWLVLNSLFQWKLSCKACNVCSNYHRLCYGMTFFYFCSFGYLITVLSHETVSLGQLGNCDFKSWFMCSLSLYV